MPHTSSSDLARFQPVIVEALEAFSTDTSYAIELSGKAQELIGRREKKHPDHRIAA